MTRGAYLIWKKEMLEVVRDRRTLFFTVVFPLLLYPGLFLVTSQVALESQAQVESETAVVAVHPAVPEGLRARVDDATVRLEDAPDLAAAREALRAETLAAVLDVGPDFEAHVAGTGTRTLPIAFDATREVSQRVRGQLEKWLLELGRALADRRLEARSLPATTARPILLEDNNIAPPEAVGGHFLGRIAPLLILMMIAMGAFYPAIEVTVGEKERGTLQTLLTAPVTAFQIISGKFLSVFAVSALAGAANLVSIGLLLLLASRFPGEISEAISIDISLGAGAAIAWVALLSGLFFAAVMMMVATWAKSGKEAQAWMTPVYLLTILPTTIAQMPGIELDGGLRIAPVLSHALALRELLEGAVDLGDLFAVTVSSLLYTGLALVVAARSFEHEATVLGDGGFLRPSGARHIPEPVVPGGDAMAFLAVVFVLLFYGGALLQSWHLLGGVAITQWLLILAPCLAFLRWRKADVRQSLGLATPPWTAWVAAIALGLSAWYPVLYGASRLASEVDSPSRRMLEETFRQLLGAEVPLALVLFAVAVSPAVCEEVLFRGVLLRAFLRRQSPRMAVLSTALLFGAFHMSVDRFFPTALLGVVLGLMAVRFGSLWPGVVFHGLHNGVSVLLARFEVQVPGITGEGPVDPVHVGAVVAAVALGALLIARGSGGRVRAAAEPPGP